MDLTRPALRYTTPVYKLAAWPSGKAEVCKTSIPRFESGCRLQKKALERGPFFLFFSGMPIDFSGICEDVSVPFTLAALGAIRWRHFSRRVGDVLVKALPQRNGAKFCEAPEGFLQLNLQLQSGDAGCLRTS